MENGTYAEALEAGFTERQAGMLARLGAQTRHEAIQATKPGKPGVVKKALVAGGLVIGTVAAVALIDWMHGYPLGRALTWIGMVAVLARIGYIGWHYSDDESTTG